MIGWERSSQHWTGPVPAARELAFGLFVGLSVVSGLQVWVCGVAFNRKKYVWIPPT